MVDVLTLEQHRYNMSRIRGKNTTAEAAVRRLLRPLGYAGRYSIKVRTLPGCPDIGRPKGRRVIFVHRGYSHMHKCLLGAVRPKTNEEFWQRNTSEMQTGQEESPQVRKGMVGLDSLGVKRGMSFSQRS